MNQMIAIGEYNELEVLRDTSAGLFLGDNEGHDVLLPGKYIPAGTAVGDRLKVFIYKDSEDRIVATTEIPKITLHHFALLRTVMVNEIGAFMDWGLEKQLFIPYREQNKKMEEGRSYVIFMFLDEQTERLVGSARLNHYLDNESLTVRTGDEVDLLIWDKTDLGFNVIINEQHKGLIYDNELFTDVKTGDVIKGYIKNIREDHKIDATLQKPGYGQIEPSSQKILDVLRSNGGFLALSDNSSPEAITAQLQMSKKTFKKAVGTLYRKKTIVLKADGIHLA
jgi:predicted RNA-binding protein (virulence factor B family)